MLFVGLVSTITSQTNPHQIGSEYLRLFCELACVLCVFPTGLVTSGRLWLYQGQNRCASGGSPLVEMFGLVHPVWRLDLFHYAQSKAQRSLPSVPPRLGAALAPP